MPDSTPIPSEEYTIRFAVADDACSIARVHVESWKTTYNGIFPDSLLSKQTLDKRESSWREILANAELLSVNLVACKPDGEVVGFISGGSERAGSLGYEGELYAVYLLQSHQRQGLGKRLVARLARELALIGFRSMVVRVVAANPATKFYESLGGSRVTEKPIERGGQSFVEVAYGWKDLRRLQ